MIKAYETIVRNLSLARFTRFSSNQNNTVRTACSINSRCRSIFHNINAFDIINIDILQTIFHLETINNI